MPALLFPRIIDNTYRGQWLALVLFVPLLLLKLAMGFNMAGFNPFLDPRQILQDIDGIPLDAYGSAAAADLVFFASAWAAGLLTIGLFGVIALVRYRAMIPLAFLLLTFEQIGRELVHFDSFGAPDVLSTASLINWGFSGALILGFVLSIVPRRQHHAK
ncbi:MAG: hypothetical protein ACK5HY_06310 [Parahaliea sp.]